MFNSSFEIQNVWLERWRKQKKLFLDICTTHIKIGYIFFISINSFFKLEIYNFKKDFFRIRYVIARIKGEAYLGVYILNE